MPRSLAEIVASVKPTGFLDYRLFLESVFQRAKHENSSYTYKQFAADLGFGATTAAHQIVRGHRPLTLKAAPRIIKALALTGVERRYFLALVEYGNTRDAHRRDELFESMLKLKERTLPDEADKDLLQYFSEWFHPVVRELVGTPGFKNDAEWIARTIVPAIRPEQAEASLALLTKLKLIRFDEEKARLVQTGTRVSTGHRVKGMALVSYHQQMIELAKLALTRVPGHRRDISAMTVNIDEASVERLKGMIHAFQLSLLEAAEKSSGDQVYEVNIQLFPFTAPSSDDKLRGAKGKKS